MIHKVNLMPHNQITQPTSTLADEPQGAPVMSSAGFCCPLPLSDYPTVTLAHGGGGRLSQMLIEKMLLPAFANPALEMLHDGALIEAEGARWAFSTDSFVVSPLFFPGGDIGSLAVYGTINDLAMCGARPLCLSAGLILEEGLAMDTLCKGDGIFINTAGLGLIPRGIQVSPQRACPGDQVLVSGAIGIHGVVIMSAREGLAFETSLASDSAPLHELVARILEVAGAQVHVLRDPTRGGVASALNEIAARARVGIRLDEAAIPVWEEVRGACEILGLDPLYVANEGRCLAIVAAEAAEAVLEAMRSHPLGREAAIIGQVVADHPGMVTMRSRIGGLRIVEMLSGEQLPRIC